MGPSMHMDFASLLRALQETIIPALPASESLAVEQAHLMRSYLQRLDQQSEYFLHAKLHELKSCFRLLGELRAIAATGAPDGDAEEELLEKAAVLAEVKLPSYQEMDRVVDGLRELAEEYSRHLVLVIDDIETKRSIHEVLMEHAVNEAIRERIWSKSMGFDADSQSLPSLEDFFRHEV